MLYTLSNYSPDSFLLENKFTKNVQWCQSLLVFTFIFSQSSYFIHVYLITYIYIYILYMKNGYRELYQFAFWPYHFMHYLLYFKSFFNCYLNIILGMCMLFDSFTVYVLIGVWILVWSFVIIKRNFHWRIIILEEMNVSDFLLSTKYAFYVSSLWSDIFY